MSEITQIDSQEAIFRGFDSLVMDPSIRRVFSMIETYNQLLRDEPTSERDVKALVAEIDTAWVDFIDQPAMLTGRATFPDEYSEQRAATDSYYEEDSVVFKGVTYLRTDRPKESGSHAETEEKESYQLVVGFERESIDLHSRLATLEGIAKTDDIVALEFPGVMSAERARWMLRAQHEELIDDIDSALYADVLDESDRVLGLASLAYEPTGDLQIDRQIISALNVYVSNTLTLDTHIGYAFSVDGRVWMQDSKGEYHPVTVKADAISRVVNLSWTSTPYDARSVTPHLEMTVSSAELVDDSDLIRIQVPIASLTKLQSLRRMYFNGTLSGE